MFKFALNSNFIPLNYRNVKIEILSIGRNKIQAIKNIREYSGVSLKDANDICDNLPQVINCYTVYEKIPDIFTDFENSGCKIKVETGHSKRSKADNALSLSLTKVLFKTKPESSTKTELKKREDAIEFLKKRQNFQKAIGSGIIASFVLIGLFVTYTFTQTYQTNPKFSTWISGVLIALAIGYSIKKRGRGIEKKFGILAAAITVFTNLAIVYVNFAIFLYESEYGIFSIFSLTPIWQNAILLPTAVSATLSYFTAYTFIRLKTINNDAKLKAGMSVSEYINEKRENVKIQYKAFHKPDIKQHNKTSN